MQNKLYIGNLSYDATSKDLIDHFSQFGHVAEAMIITNKHTGKSKGFGFISFESDEDAERALSLHETDFMGRNLVVQKAKPTP